MPDYIRAFEDGNSQRDNQPAIIDLVTLEILKFQTIPLEMAMNGETNYEEIKPSGRNNPIYHATGSNDQIRFSISWYSNHESREDVIRHCQWLYSLTKSDGYNRKQHEIRLLWGDLYKESQWIVAEANYKLGLFNREKGMKPMHAVQDVVLNRITTKNLSIADFQNINY